MPVTFVTFGLGYLAIIGFPGLSGFFSKDKIIEAAFAKGGTEGWILGGVALLGAAITAYYMTRVMLMTFFGEERWQPDETATSRTRTSPQVDDDPHDRARLRVGLRGRIFSIGDRFLHWLEPVTRHAEGNPPVSAFTVTLSTMVVLVIGAASRTPSTGAGRSRSSPRAVAAHPGRPARPPPGRLQPRRPGARRRAPHPLPGLRRPHPGRRGRQRYGGLLGGLSGRLRSCRTATRGAYAVSMFGGTAILIAATLHEGGLIRCPFPS